MEKQKLIYVESKAQFSPSEVSDKAIVFIEDTKEIWTHGVYFSCSGAWATPITLSLTGDTTGSVSIDGSGNASITTTTNYLATIATPADANDAASTLWHKISYYRVNSSASNLFPAGNNANGILSLNVHDYSYTHQLGFSSDGNIYHRRRSAGTWDTSWKTILNSSNYTNFHHTFASLTNKPTTLSGYGITDCIPIISGGKVTTDTDLSTLLGMTTYGAKLSVSYANTQCPWMPPYSNFLMFRSTSDTYSGISTGFKYGHVTFIGGRNSETTTNNAPNWWFGIKGSSETTYDLNSFQNKINNLDSNYLRKSGGTMTGILTLTTGSAYINDTASGYSIYGSMEASNTSIGTSGLATIFSGAPSLNMVLRTSGDNLYHYNHAKSARYLILDTNNYSSYALPLSGGTMKGALNFANNTWNKVGDDAYMGDCDVAGMIGIKGSNADTPGFAMYNNSGTLLGKLYASGTSLYWSNAKILTASGTSTQFVMGDGSLYSDTVSYTTWDKTTTSGIAWFPIVDITDQNQGTALFMVKAYAHSSIIFTVTKGYSNGNINVLAGGGSFNNSFAYIKGVRQVGTVVELGLNASATKVNVIIRVLQPTFTYSLRSSLVESTSTTTPYVQYELNTNGGNPNFGIISSKFTGKLVGNADTASNISTVNPILAQPYEKNAIQIVSNPQGALAEQQETAASITHALRFNWYNTAYEIGNVRGGASNSLGFGITYGNNNLCLLVKTNGTYSPYGFIGDLTGNAASASKWKDARTITLTGDVTGSVSLDGSSNVTLATTTSGTGTTSFLKCPDKRNSYPAQIVTSGGNIGAAFIHKSMLGGAEGTWYDAIILRGYVDDSAGNENALLFGKSTSSVYHSQYAFGSTTTWGTMYKFLDSGNYTNYTINNTKSDINNTGFVGVVNGNNLYYHGGLSFARFVQHDNSGRFSYELIAELTNYGTGTNTSYITYGISGFMWAYRGGNGANSGAYPITAIVNVGPAVQQNMLRIPVTTNALIPFVVKYNDKYYIALRKNISSTTFYFMGIKLNLLTTSIIVNDASLIEEIAGPITETSTASKFYNNGNPQTYLHAGNYSSYALPLTGGTLTGKLIMQANSIDNLPQIYRTDAAYISGIRFQNTLGYLGAIGMNAVNGNLQILDTSGTLYPILDSRNYNNYAAAKSHTHPWSNITGKPDFDQKFIYATSSTYYNYGTTEASGSSSTLTRTQFWRDNDRVLIGMYVQHSVNMDYGFELASSYGADALIYRRKFNGTWETTQTVLTSSNYNSYSPTLTGTGASGTWAINISGVAASASNVANALTIQLNGGTTAGTNKFVYDGAAAYTVNITPDAIGAAASSHNHDTAYLKLSGGTLGSSSQSETNLYTQSSTAKLRLLSYSDSTNYIQSGNSEFTGNATLKITGYNNITGTNLYFKFSNIYCRDNDYINIDSGNYGSYALPLSGGTLTDTLISRDIRPSANLSYSLGTSSYYYNYVYANYFKKNGSSDSYVLLGGGGHKAVSDFAPNNVATLSSSGMGNSDQWTLVFEKSYPANYWYAPTTMFYIRSGTAGCGILCFYNYWASGTQLDDYEREVWFFGAQKSETGITFGGANRDINDFFRIYIDKANFKYCIYYNRYNDQSLKIQELQFFTVPEPGEYLSTGSLRSSFFTNSTTVVDLPTESSTLVRVPIKTTYNHDRTIKTTKSIYASSFYENSDIRLKENVRGIDQSDLTKQVDLVQFNFKDGGTKKYGVIAQQLEQVGLQNLVYENNGNKAVDYISLLVLEIQRLRNEIGELKQEINKKN